MKVAVSACLLGTNCKYDGGNNFSPVLAEFLKDKQVVPICPEVLAGFPIPRPRIERRGTLILNEHGEDVTEACLMGVSKALMILEGQGIDLVILQSRSPSCGVKQIYDGTFTGKKINGQGVFAEALTGAGYVVMDIEDLK